MKPCVLDLGWHKSWGLGEHTSPDCGTVCVCVCVCVVGGGGGACIKDAGIGRVLSTRNMVASLVCSGLPSVVLWDVWSVLLGICAWSLSGSLPGVSHHCLSIFQIARCFSPGAPPRRQLLKWPCDLPVSCPGVSRLARRGLSLHGLVL
jgi:hypothetical protein